MTDLEPGTLAAALLDELQQALRARDTAAALDLFAEDAVVLATAAENVQRHEVVAYLTAVVDQDGYVRWDWERRWVVDARPGAVTFVALGTVRLAEGPAEDDVQPIRLTCLAVDQGDRWRLRLFHGSVPSR